MKTKSQTRLTIPMPTEHRTQLKALAEHLGFDSAQALLRYVSKTVIDGRRLTFGGEPDDWGEPSDEAAERLNRWTQEAKRDLKAGKLKGYKTAKAFLHSLDR